MIVDFGKGPEDGCQLTCTENMWSTTQLTVGIYIERENERGENERAKVIHCFAIRSREQL